MNAFTGSGSLPLYWLPPAEDWAARIGAIERLQPDDEAWQALVGLANTRLDLLRTERLDRALRRLFGAAPPPGLQTSPVRLALLGSSTTAHLAPAIRVGALRRGLWATIHEPHYGQYRLALADDGSALHAFRPNAVLFALDARHLVAGADATLDAAQAAAEVDAVAGQLTGLWTRARTAFGCQVIQQTVLPVFPPLLGLNEHRLPGAPAAMAARLNERLRMLAAEQGADLLTLDDRAAQDGVNRWHDPVLWHRAKQEVSPLAAPIYGDLAARLLAAGQGRIAKCLVLDLDNTLWGGVIGDDGIEGIVLGQGSASGEAFAAFQAHAAALAKRGVLLAVCSKNDEVSAVAPFADHPDMILKRADIAAFVANWNNKPANLRSIARSLNIGMDALVFVDDNPFERDLVRRELPAVSVPELPEDPALFARCLSDAGYFEALSITADDRQRSEQYRANRERASLQADATDMAAYLRSLDMRLAWRPFDDMSLDRTTQLINKTNQFNLTTRRHTRQDVANIADDPRSFGIHFRLTDRFGDNGIVAVAIGRLTDPDTVELDTLLMSCRVLGRRVEEAVLEVIMAEARRLGASSLIGRYRPTARNAMVADLYPRLGFTAIEDDGSAGEDRLYRIAVAVRGRDLPFVVVRN